MAVHIGLHRTILVLLLTSTPFTMAFSPNLEFNMTFSDMHAFWTWNPGLNTSSPSPYDAWTTTFSDSPTYVPGMIGVGESAHTAQIRTTSMFTPSISLPFFGRGMWVEGALDANWQSFDTTFGPFYLSLSGARDEVTGPPNSSTVAGVELSANARCEATFSARGVGTAGSVSKMTIKGITLQMAIQCPKA